MKYRLAAIINLITTMKKPKPTHNQQTLPYFPAGTTVWILNHQQILVQFQCCNYNLELKCTLAELTAIQSS